MDENASTTRRSRVHLSEEWAISVVSLSCLQHRRNRLLESIVVLSMEVMLKASTGLRASLFPRQ
jgi:hypothetical protein